MTKQERRELIKEVYARACAGCARSIKRLRELTRKHRQGVVAKCSVCGRWCRAYTDDPRCFMHRSNNLAQRARDRKTLTSAALMLLAVTCLGADVRLAWDASPTEGITNYVIYAHTNAITQETYTNAVVRINVGTNLTATVEDPSPARWWFTVTAMRDGLESDISNVIEVEVPAPPSGMRTVIVQYSGTLTNFQDVGFFRLRIGIP